ncbi:MAG: pilus assembly PilX N-terminal domain-containing protein [Vicinamibacteria bacterium]|jgi:hypothetical protein|nr:pilus assembly PilX N-terminal domain-containing protein [Vicinamibacteria bacterium]
MKPQAATIQTRKNEAGFALVLAMLSLMLLTFLGLTLAATTTMELQIATNYRWSQQAYYNAEAGLDVGKKLLLPMNWAVVLPPARVPSYTPSGVSCLAGEVVNPGLACWTVASPAVPPPAPFNNVDATSAAPRNYEFGGCDKRGGGIGYGVVLDDGAASGAPFQNVTTFFGKTLIGSVTLWTRRALVENPNGSFTDDPSDTTLILVSEGVAPYQGRSMGNQVAIINRAVRTLEVSLSHKVETIHCENRGGQVGGGPEGSNFSACDPINGGPGLTGLGSTGTNVEHNAGWQ